MKCMRRALLGNSIPGMFWKYTCDFIEELANYLQDKKVLEVFAGNGLLASLLFKEGVQIKATSIGSGMDAHNLGFYYDVESLSVLEAVMKYGGSFDTLLMCWPTTTEQASKAIEAWEDKDIIFIGEVTDYSKGYLGGCATDSFFEKTRVVHTFTSYLGNYSEYAQVRRLKNNFTNN